MSWSLFKRIGLAAMAVIVVLFVGLVIVGVIAAVVDDDGTTSTWSAYECDRARERARLFAERCAPQSWFGEPDQEACELWHELEWAIADNCE